jgi:hypothetical protein
MSLEEIYLDGIYATLFKGGLPQHLDALADLGKWLLKGFTVR